MICLNATPIPRNSITIRAQGAVPNQRSNSQPINALPTRLPISAEITRLPWEYPLSASTFTPCRAAPSRFRLSQSLIQRGQTRIVRIAKVLSGFLLRHAATLT